MSQSDFNDLENTTQPMVAVDRAGAVAFASHVAAELLGYSRDELVGMPVEALMPERFRARHAELRKGYRDRPRVRRMGAGLELSVLARDGREIPVEIGLRPFKDRYVIAVIRDISVSVSLREQLKEREARLHAIAVSTADLIVEADLESGEMTWYGDVDKALGYDPGQFPRTRAALREAVHPEDRAAIDDGVEQLAESAAWHMDYRVRCRDGAYRYWQSRGRVIEWIDDRPKTVVGAIQDVTERVLREQALQAAMQEAKQQAELNQSILSSVPSQIALLDANGEVIAVNRAWTEFTEANSAGSRDGLGIGANYLEVCRRAGATSVEARAAHDGIAAILAGSRDRFTMEYACHSPEEERWFWMTVNPSAGSSGGAVIVHVDRTDGIAARRELEQTLQEVARLKKQLEGEHQYLRDEIKSDHNFEEIIGQSSAMKAMLETVEQVADTDATVLLLGETGTGKELVARAVHSRSRRKDRTLIKVDCASIPSGLVESELFGHMKGSFTGAHESRPGRFELADKGTIFLDEIGELSADLQAKLLRVLQEGEIQRIGSRDVKSVDVRVIAATNRDLKREVEAGRFRADLYYRLNVFPIQLPPLRHRREDIPLLTAFFISKCAAHIGRKIDQVPTSVQQTLASYDWPGNVRELRNVIERAVIVSKGGVLSLKGSLEEMPAELESGAPSLRRDLEEIERQNIIAALEQSGWKIKGEDNAASRLGLSPSTLRSRMKRLGIERRA